MKAVLLTTVLLLLTSTAEARRVGRVAPILVRMVACINEKVEGVRAEFTWPVTLKGKRYELYVLNLTVMQGSVTPLDIDAAVAPYSVKFQVVGDKQALARFASTRPRQQVVLTGYVRMEAGARYLMLDKVEDGGGATPGPAP